MIRFVPKDRTDESNRARRRLKRAVMDPQLIAKGKKRDTEGNPSPQEVEAAKASQLAGEGIKKDDKGNIKTHRPSNRPATKTSAFYKRLGRSDSSLELIGAKLVESLLNEMDIERAQAYLSGKEVPVGRKGKTKKLKSPEHGKKLAQRVTRMAIAKVRAKDTKPEHRKSASQNIQAMKPFVGNDAPSNPRTGGESAKVRNKAKGEDKK